VVKNLQNVSVAWKHDSKPATPYLPVSSFYRHSTFYSHADHRLQAMDNAQILTIVDTSTSLDDICGERSTNLPQNTSDWLSALLMGWIIDVNRLEMVD
jgi:hypothetical protein